MIGVDRNSGLPIRDNDYLRDRIASCLSMREGTHPMRRHKGSRIPAMIDRPTNRVTIFEIQVAAIDALSSEQNGFGDLTLLKVVVDKIEAGVVHLTVVFKQDGLIDSLVDVVVSR